MILMRGKDIAQVISLPRSKIIRGKRHIKNRFSGYFMQMRTEWLFQGPNTHRYVNSWSGGGLSAKPGRKVHLLYALQSPGR